MAGNSAAILTAQPPHDADVRLAYGDSQLQFGDLRLPAGEGPHPLVVVVHRGYWQAIYNLTHAGHLCARSSRSVRRTSTGRLWNAIGWPSTGTEKSPMTYWQKEMVRCWPSITS